MVFRVKRDRLNEANLLIPLLSVLIQAKFGNASQNSGSRKKLESDSFYWDSEAQQMKQNDDATTAMGDDDDFSLDSDDSYVTNLTAALNLGAMESPAEGGGVFDFDLDFVFDDVAPSNQYGDNGSIKTFMEVCKQKSRVVRKAEAAAAAAAAIVSMNVDDEEVDSKPAASDTTSTASTTTPARTLTEEPTSAPTLERMMVNNPNLVQQFLTNNPQLFNQTPPPSTVSPKAGVDGHSHCPNSEAVQMSHGKNLDGARTGGSQCRERSPKRRKRKDYAASVTTRKEIKRKKYNTAFDQLSMCGCNITKKDSNACFDIMKTKRENTIRVGLQNMNLLPERSKHYKSRQAVDHIKQGECDSWLGNEGGLCWSKLEAGDQ